MAFRFVGGDNPDQVYLLPPDAREWLPARHLAWQLLSVAQELDLAPFLSAYRTDGRSRPPYHPASMLGLVMYCYCKGIRSSRAIEMACWDDLGARVIMGNRQPDHSTIARFVDRHAAAVKGLLVQTLVVCATGGLLRVDVVAGDGTVVKANAASGANRSGEQLEDEIVGLTERVEAEVASWFAQAAAEDALFSDEPDDDGDRSPRGPGTLAHTVDKLLRRRAAKARLDELEQQRADEITEERTERVARWEQRVAAREEGVARARAAQQAKLDSWQQRADQLAATGGKPGGRRPVEADQHSEVRRARDQLAAATGRLTDALAAAAAPIPAPDKPLKVNTTDIASRVIPGKNGGGYLQGHNVQVVAAKGQIILDIATHDSSNDLAALHPALRRTRANLDAAGITTDIGAALFDAGYASDANFTTATPDPATVLYVSVTKEARQTGRAPQSTTTARGSTIESWQQMAARLSTEEGRTLYKQRAAIVEPVFAQLFNRLGRALHYRNDGVPTELHLWASSHNLLKIMKHRIAQALA
jgi:transposase